MSLLSPSALWLLLFIPLMAVYFVWRSQVRKSALKRLGDPQLIASLVEQIDPNRRRLKSGLWLLSLAAVILALARPAWGIAEEVVEDQGIAIIAVLDVSASMDARDMLPSRLERAKLAARDLFANSEGNQLGLVLFAGSAFVQFPLTTDVDAALTFVDAATTRSISRQGTTLEDALQLAVDRFDDRIASHGVIIVLSDGENHEGQPVEAARVAEERGIIIHAIGYGDPVNGEPIPILSADGTFEDGYKTDGAGNLVLTRLEETILQVIADATGGTYQRASDSGIEIVNLINEIAAIEQTVLDTRRQTRRVDRFHWFITLALVALSFEIFLPETRISPRRTDTYANSDVD